MADLALPRHPADARFLPLPSPRDAAGATRRVGVEAEFVGIGARGAARALQAGLGGAVVEQDPHAFLLRGTSLGDLAVELDVRYAHPRAHGPELPLRLGPRAAAWLGSALGGVVPREVITGPMAVEALAGVDRAVDLLRRAGAKGRGVTWFGSLGLHFNVDPARLDAPDLVPVLRAFLLLEPWLRHAIAPGRGRRPAAFLPGRYPEVYVRRVVAPGYRPDLPTFAADYLDANPTRDRALDLLPILLHLDGARVRARLPHEKIGGRPVLHYRLPRAHVGEPGWGIAPDWNRWVAVERLAADPDRLDALGREYLAFAGTEEDWARLARAAAGEEARHPVGGPAPGGR